MTPAHPNSPAAGSGVLPAEAWAIALSMLPGCGQQRLRTLLDAAGGDPERAWRAIRGNRPHDLGDRAERWASGRGALLFARWSSAANGLDVPGAWNRVTATGGVWLHGAADYPAQLVEDPDPPPVLFWQGECEALAGPAVALVGTRRCTSYGSDVARELGRDLAAAGVSVVSGLALGIDGAAHEGALAAAAAAPIAVVGSGLDVVYPPRHRALWRRVADAGLLLSEAPPGAAPEPWRFPRRNRILAALSTVVVVVESHASGGSLSTVKAAAERGVAVMAVPGSVRSPSSAGTNRLLADGVAPVTDAEDVLVALSLEGAHRVAACPSPPGTTDSAPGVAADLEPESPVLAAVDWTPTATEDVLRRTGLSISEVSTALTRLEVQGRVKRRGGWWERVSAASITP